MEWFPIICVCLSKLVNVFYCFCHASTRFVFAKISQENGMSIINNSINFSWSTGMPTYRCNLLDLSKFCVLNQFETTYLTFRQIFITHCDIHAVSRYHHDQFKNLPRSLGKNQSFYHNMLSIITCRRTWFSCCWYRAFAFAFANTQSNVSYCKFSVKSSMLFWICCWNHSINREGFMMQGIL